MPYGLRNAPKKLSPKQWKARSGNTTITNNTFQGIAAQAIKTGFSDALIFEIFATKASLNMPMVYRIAVQGRKIKEFETQLEALEWIQEVMETEFGEDDAFDS